MSVIARCAATPRIWELRERAGRVDDRRRADRHRQLRQQLPVALGDHVVHQVFGRRGQHEAGEPVDQHQPQPEREPAAMDPDQAARFFPGAGGERFFLRSLGRADGYGRARCLFRMGHPVMIRRLKPGRPIRMGGTGKALGLARFTAWQAVANGCRQPTLIVGAGRPVAARLERLGGVAHDIGGAGEVEHLDVVQVVADRDDLSRRPAAPLRPTRRASSPWSSRRALMSTSEKSRGTYSVIATEN